MGYAVWCHVACTASKYTTALDLVQCKAPASLNRARGGGSNKKGRWWNLAKLTYPLSTAPSSSSSRRTMRWRSLATSASCSVLLSDWKVRA